MLVTLCAMMLLMLVSIALVKSSTIVGARPLLTYFPSTRILVVPGVQQLAVSLGTAASAVACVE
jgi:hypothetical protein